MNVNAPKQQQTTPFAALVDHGKTIALAEQAGIRQRLYVARHIEPKVRQERWKRTPMPGNPNHWNTRR
jgi:hypothetical protein